MTSFLPHNTILKQRIWHLMNNYYEIPKCEICGNECHFTNTTENKGFVRYNNSTYSKFCCRRCEDINKTLQSQALNPLSLTYNEIITKTASFDDFAVAQRLWHINNNYYEIPKCEICKKTKSWNIQHHYYSCCSECSKKMADKTLVRRYGFGISELHKTEFGENAVEKIKNNYKDNKKKESIIFKHKQTCLERYGVDCYTKSHIPHQNRISNINNLLSNTNVKCVGVQSSDVSIRCDECESISHIEISTLMYRLKKGNNVCTKCYHIGMRSSGIEKQFQSYMIETYGDEFDIKMNDRKLLKGCGKNNSSLELDVLFKDLNLAFEFNGDYWHMNPRIYSEDKVRKGNKHNIMTARQIWEKDHKKKIMCVDRGVMLINVWEMDWENRCDVVKRYIDIIIKNNKNNENSKNII